MNAFFAKQQTQRRLTLTPNEMRRYSRHLALPEVGPEGQQKLKQSSAVVIGLGGLGVPAAVYLASAGVGQVGIVDFDPVELSNLQRQYWFSEADRGRRKGVVVLTFSGSELQVNRQKLFSKSIRIKGRSTVFNYEFRCTASEYRSLDD